MSFYHVHAIIPFYSDYGENGTYVLLADGTKEIFNMPIRSYIHHMLYEAHLDPKALQYWSYKIIGNKLNNPLILGEDLIFIPVKIRRPIGRADGSFGYILLKSIAAFDDHTLVLSNHIELQTLSSKNYILKKQRDATLLRYAYLDHRKTYAFMNKF